MKIYIYNHGYCRGHEFSSKFSFELDDMFPLLDRAANLKFEELDDFIEDHVVEKFSDFETEDVIIQLMLGGNIYAQNEAEINRKEWLNNLKEGKPVFIEGEEGDWAIATSPKEALATFALHGEEDNDNW